MLHLQVDRLGRCRKISMPCQSLTAHISSLFKHREAAVVVSRGAHHSKTTQASPAAFFVVLPHQNCFFEVVVKPSVRAEKFTFSREACRPQKSCFGVWMARPHVMNGFMGLMKNAVTAAAYAAMLNQVSQLSLACCTELLHYHRTHKRHHDLNSAQPTSIVILITINRS